MVAIFSAQLQHTIRTSALSSQEQVQIIDQSNKLGGIAVPDSFDPAAKESAQLVIKEAFIGSFRWAMGICAILAAGAAVTAVFMIHNSGAAQGSQN